MIVKEIKGDLLSTDLNFIAHGVNCQNKMGSGVAKAIFTKYPNVKTEYHAFYNRTISLLVNGQEDFLGCIQPINVSDGKMVFNMFTQEFYGYDGKLYASYEAIESAFKTLTEHYGHIGKLAIPKIGCGLAGANWEKVRDIINKTTGDELEVYVYYLE